MSKINRFTGDLKAFASAALGTERTIFGDIIQSDVLDDNIVAAYLRGWGIVGPNDVPDREDFNAAMFVATQLIAYLHQVGVPNYDSLQEFQQYGVTNLNGALYVSRLDSNIGNDPATDDGTNWLPLVDNTALTATVTPDADSDVTLTRNEYTAHRLELADGAWTGDHNIVVPDSTRIYAIDNTGGTYNATVKTAAGTGIIVLAGRAKIVACDGTNVVDVDTAIVDFPRGHISGLLWSNNAVTPATLFDMSAGECRSSDDTANYTLASDTTGYDVSADYDVGSGVKSAGLGAWNAANFPAGTTVHFFAVSGGTNQVGMDTSVSGANLSGTDGLTIIRPLLSLRLLADAALPTVYTRLDGPDVVATYDVPLLDLNNAGNTSGAAAVLSVPTGVQVIAHLKETLSHSSGASSLVTEAAQTNTIPTTTISDVDVLFASTQESANIDRLTDASGQVRYRTSVAVDAFRLLTFGYTFLRGI